MQKENINRQTGKLSEFNFDRLFRAYYKVLVAYAYKYLNNTDNSEEIVQELFSIIYHRKDEIHIQGNVKAYLFQSVCNRSLNFIKEQNKTQGLHNIDLVEEHEAMDKKMEAAEFEYWVYQLIENLPKATKKVFRHSRFEQMTNGEIAQKLQISKRTVETHISNALKILRKEIFHANTTDSTRSKLNLFFF